VSFFFLEALPNGTGPAVKTPDSKGASCMKKALGFLLFLLVEMSCGKHHLDNNTLPQIPPPQTQENTPGPDTGTYEVSLSSLNDQKSQGKLEIIIGPQHVKLHGEFEKLDPGTHKINILAKGECPSVSADVNSDGKIDFIEAMAISGPILVPLDADLATQEAGFNSDPMADNQGTLKLIQETSYDTFIQDLTSPDLNPSDAIVKIPAGESLNLDKRVVTVHGINPVSLLPGTMLSVAGIPSQSSIPVACGVLQRLPEVSP